MYELLNRISTPCLAINHIGVFGQDYSIILWHLILPIFENTILTVINVWCIDNAQTFIIQYLRLYNRKRVNHGYYTDNSHR